MRMAQIITQSVKADQIDTIELTTGNMVVTGKASFVQPVRADLENTTSIHDATTNQSISSDDYVFISRNNTLIKIPLVNIIQEIASIAVLQFDSAENVGY